MRTWVAGAFVVLGFLFSMLAALTLRASAPDVRQNVMQIVERIQRADYEGDRATLQRLHDQLAPFAGDRELGSRVLYWRGFAMWRRALNGFNDDADRKELAEDLRQCVADFKEALSRDPSLADAKAGAASCLVNDSFLIMGSDRTRSRELFQESATLLQQAVAAAPDNPRVLWVEGTNQFYSREDGAQGRAIATYERALALARSPGVAPSDPLQPSWGEPELLMNLAFANLHKTAPDRAAAKRYAESALALVPYWHYVRDILLVQIQKAQTPPSR